MLINSDFMAITRAEAMTPGAIALWDRLSIGVAIVDSTGICLYMNPLQKKIDAFGFPVEGVHITELYKPNKMEIIPTMQCLKSGKPLLKQTYWYKTVKNYLASTVSDFFPLFHNGKIDGVLAFTIWIDSTATGEEEKNNATHFSTSAADSTTQYSFNNLIGSDPGFLSAIDDAKIAAQSSVSVMIWGENGTGKELFAQSIHKASPRRNKPFVAVNCAAIPENLLEGILFGTVKGAYTDAADKEGLFEKANGGTLLLDELNSMPLGLQAKLLRVLQEKRVRQLGSSVEKAIDVRLISILNEDPLSAVKRGILRNDLYYRLAVVGIPTSPLRARKDDIPVLIKSFFEHEHSPKNIKISDSVMQLFWEYDWPGNIRELHHVIEGSLALLGSRSVIDEHCLPKHFLEACRQQRRQAQPEQAEKNGVTTLFDDYRDVKRNSSISLKECMQNYEAHCIRQVLHITGGNVSRAARIMQLTAPGLRYKMKQLNISDEDY